MTGGSLVCGNNKRFAPGGAGSAEGRYQYVLGDNKEGSSFGPWELLERRLVDHNQISG